MAISHRATSCTSPERAQQYFASMYDTLTAYLDQYPRVYAHLLQARTGSQTIYPKCWLRRRSSYPNAVVDSCDEHDALPGYATIKKASEDN